MFACIFKRVSILKKQLLLCFFLFHSLMVFGLDAPPRLTKPAVFADFLYWHASQETSSSWAYIPQLPNITAPNLYFKWSPGVRTGFDFLFKNKLDIKLYWTYFLTKTDESANAGNGQFLLPEFFNGFTTLTPFSSGKINWQLNLNMLDLEIGHTLSWLNRFTTRPFIGIKGGSINQNIHSNWTYQGDIFSIFPITYQASENLKNQFSGIGPSFGLDNEWNIYENLSFKGDISGAWLWGNWKIQDIYNGPSLSGLQLNTTISSNASTILGALMFRYFAGLYWTHESEISYTIKLGYEMQFWMNQLRIPVFQQVPVHGDLTLQGGTCGLLIKF